MSFESFSEASIVLGEKHHELLPSPVLDPPSRQIDSAEVHTEFHTCLLSPMQYVLHVFAQEDVDSDGQTIRVITIEIFQQSAVSRGMFCREDTFPLPPRTLCDRRSCRLMHLGTSMTSSSWCANWVHVVC